MNDARLTALVERYFDRNANADEIAELQAGLRDDPQARQRYWELAEWHALFRQWGEQEWGRDAALSQHRVTAMPTVARPVPHSGNTERGQGRRGKVIRFPVARLAAGIAAAVAIGLGYQTFRSHLPVATLDQVADAAWTSGKFEAGTKLKRGSHQLESGVAVIAFDRGARVVIEGPADFEIRGGNSMKLRSGRVRAQVPPPAHGFKVETPTFTAVDIGTEFGCEVSTAGIGELHVFDGKVDLRSGAARKSTVRLSENQALRVEGSATSPLAARPLAFLSENELTSRELRSHGDFFEAWKRTSQELADHPAALLHLDFQGLPDVRFTNRATRHAATVITSIGSAPVQGRWPRKSARIFRGPGERLAISLPGQFESLTLMAWVRLENLHEGQNSLLMGNPFQAGAVHWYLYGNGSLGVGVLSEANNGPGDWHTIHSVPVIDESTSGSWVFVATVLDGSTKVATHYFNGVPVSERDSIVQTPLQLAAAEIADYSLAPQLKNDPPFNFNGSIDELAVLSTALKPEDIARLYQQGKPGTR